MDIPTVAEKDAVLFVAGPNHALDCEGRLFEWRHVKDGPVRNSRPSARAGNPCDLSGVGAHQQFDREAGCLHTMGGFVLKPVGPKAAWAATVLAVKPDGRLDLEIQHPHGHKLEYLDVPYSADGAPHSWHPVAPAKGA